MRWRVDFEGRFERYVDADDMRDTPFGGVEFVNRAGDGLVAVFTVSPELWRRHVSASRVPTFRMVGGPKDGQVAAAPDKVPERIHFQAVVALGEDGETLAPMPPHHVRGLNDTYVHHPFDCPCHGARRGLVEHLYVWPPGQRSRAGILPSGSSRAPAGARSASTAITSSGIPQSHSHGGSS